MSITVGGKPVSFTALANSVPLVTVPMGTTGVIAIHYSLPHSNFILIAVVLGIMMLAVIAVVSIRRRA
jgi:hypothetical protein